MPIPESPLLVDMRSLRLDAARALLHQAEHGSPEAPMTVAERTQFLQGIIDGLCELSLRDPLTTLANRRAFRGVLDREMDRVARAGESALLLMMDIDHFKSVNDTYGHTAGDQVLQAVARILTACVRPMDMLARYGGEEFAVVLPGCQAAFGQVVAERIRLAVESTPLAVSPSLELHVTISIGGAYAMPWIRSTAELWTVRADHQLYCAKALGRNRVCIEEPPDSTVTAEEKKLLYGIGSADITVHAAAAQENAAGSAN